MALFALREGYRVETTPTGGRVVHVRTGDTLELNFSEIQLLARAAAGGIEAGDSSLKAIVRKLSGLGLLERVGGLDEPAEAAPSTNAEPLPEDAKVDEGLWVFAPPQGNTPVPVVGPETPTEVAELPKPVEKRPSDPTEEPQLDFAAPAEPAAPEKPAEPPPSLQSPDLLVPVFRADLVLKRKDKGGVFDVTDPANGKTFAFYDFEISIARMLNGQRKFGEVVTAANALGIPVSVESLSQFVRQLQRYGFLAPDGTAVQEGPPGSVWGKRAKWNNSIRTLFQSGLRLTRQGRYYEAAAYFEAILEHDPGNPEAVEMLQQVKEHLAKLPPDAPAPHPHLDPAELSATQEGLDALDPDLPAAESSLESLDGSLPDAAAETTTDQPLPGPDLTEPALEVSRATTEVSDLSAALAAADKPADWSELASAPAPTPAEPDPAAMPDEPPPFDPFAEPAAVQPLGLNAQAAPEPAPKPAFDPFADSHVAAPDPFPAPQLKTRQPTVNPFARPTDRPVDPPRATPDPFAAIPPPSASTPTATPVPDAKPFDPFADGASEAAADGHQPLESLLNAEPELPKFDAAALEGPPEAELPVAEAKPLTEVTIDLAQAVDSVAKTVAEQPATKPPAAAAPTPSIAEAVLEPIPDETLDVDGIEPVPAPSTVPGPIPAAPIIEALFETPAAPVEAAPAQAMPVVEAMPAEPVPVEAAAPAPAQADKPAFDPFTGVPELAAAHAEANEPTPIVESKPVGAEPAPSKPPEPAPAPVRPPSGPAMPAPKLAPPPSSKGKFLFGGLGLAAVAGGLVWFFMLRTPATQPPPVQPPVVALAGPDAQAPAPAGPDAAAEAVQVAAVDASAAAPEALDAATATGADAAAEAGLDAAAAGPDAAAPGLDAAQAGLDAAAQAATAQPTPGGDEGWTTVEVAKRGRVNMGDVKAPVAGTVTWGVTANQERIRKGQVIGKIADADGNEVALMAPNVGLLNPKAADGAAVQANAVIASVPYFEAYGQTPFPGSAAPTPDWACEIVDEATNQKAACKVNKADARKAGFYVTFTAEPLWFDTAAKLKLRLKAP